MLKLHGFSSSNYYNFVKLALLEKELTFEETLIYTGAGDGYHPEYLEKSPLGKVPCLETEEGFLSESRCIVDYLEQSHQGRPLYPPDAFARAKVVELMQVIELYLELVARRLLPGYFARKAPHPVLANEVKTGLEKGTRALQQLASFGDYAIGNRFTAADISCIVHLPLVRRLSRSVLNVDPLATVPKLDSYVARMESRATVARIRADEAESLPRFGEHLRERYGIGG
jgi:glutathione S-transferase